MDHNRRKAASDSADQAGDVADAALAEYLRRLEAGESINREEFLEAYPEAAEALQSYFDGADALDEVAQRRTPHKDSFHSAATIPPRGSGAQSSAAGPFSELPTQFGRFRVDRLLGRGAMGAVYLAWDPQLERPVALKVPNVANLNDEIVTRLLREARAAAILSHPHICHVYDVGTQDDLPFIAMEYIEGRPLSAYIDPANLLDDRRCAGVVRKLALALAEAHAKGIIHRDLKPANILINHRGEPILTDFGLARLSQSSDGRVTQSGTLIGSPAYMSPEQANADASRVGPRSDIYGLGVLLFELLTAELPFQGSVLTILSQIATKEPPAPSSLRPGLDVRLDAICLKMMAKNPDDRFASMKAVEQELGNWLKTEPVVLPPKKDTASTTAAPAGDASGMERRARKLLDEHDYESAIPILIKLAALDEKQFKDIVQWAKAELPAARQKLQKLRERCKAACEKARNLREKHDYAGAVHVLESIPEAAQSEEVCQLLSEVTELADECSSLRQEIDDALLRKRYSRLVPLIERYLKLKPDSGKFQRLLADLVKNRPARAVANYRGTRRYIDVAGRLVEPKEVALSAFAILGLFFAVTFGLRGYLANSKPSGNTWTPPLAGGGSSGESSSGQTARDGSQVTSQAFQRPALPAVEQRPLTISTHGLPIPDFLESETMRPVQQLTAWRHEGAFGRIRGAGELSFPLLAVSEFALDLSLTFENQDKDGLFIDLRSDRLDDEWVRSRVIWDVSKQKVARQLYWFKGGSFQPPLQRESNAGERLELTLLVGNDVQLLFHRGDTQPLVQSVRTQAFHPQIQSHAGTDVTIHQFLIRALTDDERSRLKMPKPNGPTPALWTEMARGSLFPLIPGTEYTYESWIGDQRTGEATATVGRDPVHVGGFNCREWRWSANIQNGNKQHFHVDHEKGIAHLMQQSANGIQSPPLPLYPLNDRGRNWDWTGVVQGAQAKATFTLDGPKSVTVPLGTFDAYVVKMDYSDAAGTFSHVQEDTLVPGIGLVRSMAWNGGALGWDLRLKSATGLE